MVSDLGLCRVFSVQVPMTVGEPNSNLLLEQTVTGTGGHSTLTEDENETLLRLRSNKEKLKREIDMIKNEISQVTARIHELQSEVDKNTEPKILDAIELFNDAAFEQCFQRLVEVGLLNNLEDPSERASFLSTNLTQLNTEKVHKFLFKPHNSSVMRRSSIGTAGSGSSSANWSAPIAKTSNSLRST